MWVFAQKKSVKNNIKIIKKMKKTKKKNSRKR